jgi:8-amino-3,8-dideoxy-alpha-D-manno-octulosonate transaminase
MDDFVPRRIRNRPLPDEFPGVHAMDDEEVEAAVRVCRSKSLYRYYGTNLQHETSSFEGEFASFLGVPHAVAVTSGTAALHTALAALRVGPGCEVIVPAYMWVSVIAAVVNLGAIPVLADIDETFCLDPEDVQRRITVRTAGVIAVHMSGAPADIVRLAQLTRKHGIFLLEDCAQCVGGSIDGKRVGTFGDMAIFSFQMNKNMSSGEAGAVVTSNQELYRRAVARQDAGYARSPSGKLLMDDSASYGWGRGLRLDELRAAILRVQLRKLSGTIQRMHQSKYRIRRWLELRPEISLRRIVDPAGDTSCFLITIFPDASSAQAVNSRLRLHGIASASPDTSNVLLADYGMHIYYNIPALVQKIGTDQKGSPWSLVENQASSYSYAKGACPHADDLFERSQLLAIPSCLSLSDEDEIIEAFQDALDAIFQIEAARP